MKFYGHIRITILTIVFLFLIHTPAHASSGVMTAEKLIKACTTADMHWVDFCNGFVQSIHDLGTASSDICMPERGITRTDMVSIMTEKGAIMLVNEPQMKKENGAILALAIFSRMYPCK